MTRRATVMRPVVAAIVCLCSAGTRAYPHESEQVKSEASSTRALLPNAVSALLPSDAERRGFEFLCEKQKFHAGKTSGASHTRIGLLTPGGIHFKDPSKSGAGFTSPMKPLQAQVVGRVVKGKYVPLVRVTIAPSKDTVGHSWELEFPPAEDQINGLSPSRMADKVYRALRTFTDQYSGFPLLTYRVRSKYRASHRFHGSDKWGAVGSGRYGDAKSVDLRGIDYGTYTVKNAIDRDGRSFAMVTVKSKKHGAGGNFEAKLISVPVSSERIPALILWRLLKGPRPVAARSLQMMRARSNFHILDSDVAKEITNPAGGPKEIYVLPSQLNGAEYPTYKDPSVKTWLADYFWDKTGGPAGQMAAHPAIAQVWIRI